MSFDAVCGFVLAKALKALHWHYKYFSRLVTSTIIKVEYLAFFLLVGGLDRARHP